MVWFQVEILENHYNKHFYRLSSITIILQSSPQPLIIEYEGVCRMGSHVFHVAAELP